ncbi:MAG: hypothetical protein A3G81_04900 [Betaproteobacteria bacterium RIFCSPLOWO2_12_FULL_65_14]|nr:MAG: hypothetical protein A3G81_04900 [Betaproteobacteria bacterium RIFCSPLOWO2_12_FULL_65_14]
MKGPVGFAVGALLVIWGALPLVPAAWGIRFGAPYLVFFSMAVLGSAAFFVLLNWGPVRQPESPAMTFASILLVYVGTVGGMVWFGNWYYPQFETPRVAAPQAAGESAAESRGRAVFLNPSFACFACHTIEALGIRGGQRGPDLSNAGKQAESRRPGRSAEDYLLEAIVDPWACFTPLPASGLVECQPAADAAKTYPQLMIPGLKERMSEADLKDLVVFLRSLKGRP